MHSAGSLGHRNTSGDFLGRSEILTGPNLLKGRGMGEGAAGEGGASGQRIESQEGNLLFGYRVAKAAQPRSMKNSTSPSETLRALTRSQKILSFYL